MATLAFLEPQLVGQAANVAPPIKYYQVNSAFSRGAVVNLTSGKLQDAGTNASSILGIADAGSTHIYFSSSVTDTSLFGQSVANTALMPDEPVGIKVILFDNTQYWAFSLQQSYALSSIGAQAGLNKDATTGYYTLDTSQSNKTFVIVGLVGGPGMGGVGDVGAFVVAQAIASTLQI